jgi:hypothetical protein
MPIAIFRLIEILGRNWRMLADKKITLGQMRQSGADRLHVLCGSPDCSHSVVMDADCWPGSLRLSDLEALFVCRACGHRGADLRPESKGNRGSRLAPARTSAATIR